MLEAGTITREDAERLLVALGDEPESATAEQKPMPESFGEILESAKDFGKREGSGTYGAGECELSLRSTSGSMKLKRS